MLWIKVFHLFFIMSWFAGIFYLPRLFVYHAMAKDEISQERFKIMERKLFYGIMTPSAILSLIFGFWLFSHNLEYYLKAPWMHMKLTMVFLLIIYHFACWHYMKNFKYNKNSHSHVFYRWLNEFPTIILVVVVILVVVQP